MKSFLIGSSNWAGIAKIMEEASELVVVCAKLIGVDGNMIYWDGQHLLLRLEEEVGDVLAAIDFMVERNSHIIHRENIENRRALKLETFRRWYKEQRS